MKVLQSKNRAVCYKKPNSTLAYLPEYLVHQIIHLEHPVRWRQGYLVSGNELAEPADQFQATELHMSNSFELGDFLQAMETATQMAKTFHEPFTIIIIISSMHESGA